MKAYKGFDKDLRCRGFQYEIGGEYETDEAKVCETGFHACEYPLDVLGYYPPNTSRYCEVEQDGEISKDGRGSKAASTKIRIGAELNIAGLVKAAIEYTRERCTPENSEHATGDQGAASATGTGGVALAAGYDGRACGALGCAICVCERGPWNGKTYPLLAVKAAIIDGEILKPGVWYKLVNGEFAEVGEED
jgi:hypothetical protein